MLTKRSFRAGVYSLLVPYVFKCSRPRTGHLPGAHRRQIPEANSFTGQPRNAQKYPFTGLLPRTAKFADPVLHRSLGNTYVAGYLGSYLEVVGVQRGGSKNCELFDNRL